MHSQTCIQAMASGPVLWVMVSLNGGMKHHQFSQKHVHARLMYMPHNGVQVVRTSQVPLVASGESRQVKIWEFEGTAYDQGDVAAEWITTYLGEPHRLVRYAGNVVAAQSE